MEINMRLSCYVLTLLLVVANPVYGKAKKIDDYHWSGVERVVAIGDLHGDYGQYINVMQSAGLIDKGGKWSGGKTHLVQTGDITDRGDDSRKIIDHLVKLKKQAKKKGGYVHLLIGNHETMNVVGDLRYVNPGDPVIDPTDSNWVPAARVITVRVWIVVRSISPEMGIVDSRDYEPGDVDLGVQNDNYRRMMVSKTILLRNARI